MIHKSSGALDEKYNSESIGFRSGWKKNEGKGEEEFLFENVVVYFKQYGRSLWVPKEAKATIKPLIKFH
jgi:hypothetical protein